MPRSRQPITEARRTLNKSANSASFRSKIWQIWVSVALTFGGRLCLGRVEDIVATDTTPTDRFFALDLDVLKRRTTVRAAE